MPQILSDEQFKSRYTLIWEKYQALKEKFPEDKHWKKLGRVLRQAKASYGKDKVYAVKYLNYFEMVQVSYSEERRALVVRAIELMQKVILHKKLNTEK